MGAVAGGQAAQPQAEPAVVRRAMRVEGIVQGVGFRPFVYGAAIKHGLAGWVLNDEAGVLLEVEGPVGAVDAFEHELRYHPPALAVVANVIVTAQPPTGSGEFRIIASQSGEEKRTTVPADAATCADCRQDVLDRANRRYHYPFTNCTNCGPRFTIIRDIPYDRPNTTMAGFPMCPACDEEYHNPLNRRFHAQPNACPACGPQARLVDGEGRELAGPDGWLEATVAALRAGQIVAVKGLGGFHLACDAANDAAVRRLRERKKRPHRPFAVMARDLETIRRVCAVSDAEEKQLTSPSAPIVLLAWRGGAGVAPAVAPGLNALGVMLPYTPLHLLLLQAGPPILVMTSGNPSGLPLCTDEAEAQAYLGQIADAFLIHNRPIHVPCDDSVLQVSGGEPFFLRRSRGYVPRPVAVDGGKGPALLGVGGEIKNTFCLLEGDRAVFSQHLGDQVSEEARANFRRALASMERLTGIAPAGVAYDLHPGYLSAALARELPVETKVAVQHHHAHLAACMADNRLDGEVIGLVLDGTGYGTDGAIWGFEVLAGGYGVFRRIAHLAYSPLPGSEAAIHQPLMAATGLVAAHLGETGLEKLTALVEGATFCGSGSQAGAGSSAREVAVARAMIRSGLNCPPAGTAGRLFDGVSALLGICRKQTYEGQAAIELGAVATAGPAYAVGLKGDAIDPAPLLDGLLTDLSQGLPREYLAGRFLATVAAMAVAGAEAARRSTAHNRVCLSGGTFQSAWLLEAVSAGLRERGFEVYRHRAVPPGDGGIALGQAMIARRRWQLGCV